MAVSLSFWISCSALPVFAQKDAAPSQTPAVASSSSTSSVSQSSSTNPNVNKQISAGKTEAGDSPLDLPANKLVFKELPAISGLNHLMGFISPVLCSPDGTLFVNSLESDFMTQTIYSLNSKGVHTYSTKSIPGLYDVKSKGYFVSDSVVGVLVNATKDDTKSPNKVSLGSAFPPMDYYTGIHHEYLLKFDRDGNFKKFADLPENYDFTRVAALADDKLVAVAYDRVHAAARLFLLDDDGRILQELSLPSDLKDSGELRKGESGDVTDMAKAETSLSWWLFANEGQKILLYQARSHAPILEISPGGTVREVVLDAPEGFQLDGILSAKDRWIVRLRKENLSDPGHVDSRAEAGNYALFEVNSSDGTLRRRFEIESGSFLNIACEQDGVLTAFALNGDTALLKTADISR